jgi:hypothetical protein
MAFVRRVRDSAEECHAQSKAAAPGRP